MGSWQGTGSWAPPRPSSLKPQLTRGRFQRLLCWDHPTVECVCVCACVTSVNFLLFIPVPFEVVGCLYSGRFSLEESLPQTQQTSQDLQSINIGRSERSDEYLPRNCADHLALTVSETLLCHSDTSSYPYGWYRKKNANYLWFLRNSPACWSVLYSGVDMSACILSQLKLVCYIELRFFWWTSLNLMTMLKNVQTTNT